MPRGHNPLLRDAPPGWCGIDEAGRGPLAGSVVAAAVVLDPAYPIAGLNDSKKLSATRRETLATQIYAHAITWGVGYATPAEIDQVNILQATFLAMRRALAALKVRPLGALVDGNRDPGLGLPTELVVRGDSQIACIAAASILAKTVRDNEMKSFHEQFPLYGFDRHSGYPTKEHLTALSAHGPCTIHRRSFSPLAQQRLFE